MRSISEILSDIGTFTPVDDNWLWLDELLGELWKTGKQEQGLEVMLKVLERFPEDDGGGVLWSIVHGVEEFASYESEIVSSLKRQPSEMGLIMIRRIQNSGVLKIDGIEINSLYQEISHPNLPTSIRDKVVDFLK